MSAETNNHQPSPKDLSQELQMYVNGYGFREYDLPNAPKDIPFMIYDWEQAEHWRERVENDAFSDMTVRTLLTVNGLPPVRWFSHLAETAQLLEGLKARGLQAPAEWQMMAPVHINTACNNGNPEEAKNNAEYLTRVAQAYTETFHPDVPIPQLELDNPAAIPVYLAQGEKLYPKLPDNIKAGLNRMAVKHTTGKVADGRRAAYLLAHAAAYGMSQGELFQPHPNSLYLLPQSENRFFDMLGETSDTLGYQPTESFAEQASLIMMSKANRTAHYYNHQGEITIDKLQSPDAWQDIADIPNLHPKAAQDIVSTNNIILNDIGGKQNLPQLITILRDAK